jgi:hypothetical protein
MGQAGTEKKMAKKIDYSCSGFSFVPFLLYILIETWLSRWFAGADILLLSCDTGISREIKNL